VDPPNHTGWSQWFRRNTLLLRGELHNMKLDMKLLVSFAVMSVIILIVGLVGWYGLSAFEAQMAEKNSHDEIQKILLQREIDHMNWANKVGSFQRNELMTTIDVEKNDHNCRFGKWYYSDERKKMEQDMPEVAPLLAKIEEPHRLLHQSVVELEAILAKGKDARPEAFKLFGTTIRGQHLANIQRIFDEMIKISDKYAQESAAKATRQAKFSKMISIGGMLIGTVMALILGFILSKSITKPIHSVIEDLTDASDQITGAASQISAASQNLAAGTTEQAASLEHSASSLEELSSMTKCNADNSTQARNMAVGAKEIAERVGVMMNKMNDSMGLISKSSEETGKIIKSIDEIAFQTNLLALNAAVEAARAGEAGAGFAVVADEVRNLAARAAEAAKSTNSLIDGTITAVKDGVVLAKQTQDAFQESLQIASKIQEFVDEIAAASREQAQGVEQINVAISEMEKVTQQNAATSEEAASISEQMSAQAESMLEVVKELVNIIEGGDRKEASELRMITS
jgi:methyl-accepting chemotaxis protein